MFFSSLFFYQSAHSEQFNTSLEAIEQKIKTLESLIINVSQNMILQQDLIKLLQQQLQVYVNDKEEECDEMYENDDDHRLTLRIPKSLMAKIDIKRKQRIGKISRNLWILETLNEATRK